MSVSDLTLEQEYFLIRDHNKNLCDENSQLKQQLQDKDKEIERVKNDCKDEYDIKYCCHYLDLVELIKYHSESIYNKIFNEQKNHNLKLMIDRKVTKLLEEDIQKELELFKQQLQVAVEALEKYKNIVSEYRSGGDEWAAKEALEQIKTN